MGASQQFYHSKLQTERELEINRFKRIQESNLTVCESANYHCSLKDCLNKTEVSGVNQRRMAARVSRNRSVLHGTCEQKSEDSIELRVTVLKIPSSDNG